MNITTKLAAIASAVLPMLIGTPGLSQQTHDTGGQTVGAETYVATCQACHQANGQGLPAAFPPLARHLPGVFNTDNGRDYVIKTVLFGLQGEIAVNNQVFHGIMPGWAHLSNEHIAAAINHTLTAWGNRAALPADFAPVRATEIERARSEPLTPQQVYALRGTLHLAMPSVPKHVRPPQPKRTRWFTRDQVQRGKKIYKRCIACHGARLQGGMVGGRPLKGGVFKRRWHGQKMVAYYAYLSTQMPQDRPGSLTEADNLALMAFILSNNGFQAGFEPLTAAPQVLQQIYVRPP
ncbi:MAG: cytochrome c [Candidatus Tectomicrobia bacterium]